MEIQGLINKEGNSFIRELEVSITSKCHLSCSNCGFNVPVQPNPSIGKDVVYEISQGLTQLERLNIKIGSLGVLGGEPSINKKLLLNSLIEFSKFQNINQIELVTHGLTPQNINKECFRYINKLTISVYFDSDKLIKLWGDYIKLSFPHIKLEFRKDKLWDKWLGNNVVEDDVAQNLFNNCWYRKHCVTIERERLFLCSRIPKFSKDNEGLFLDKKTTLNCIETYLNKPDFLPSCKTCIPMMKLGTVEAGKQPDNRIDKMLPQAVKFLKNEIYG